MLKESFLNYLVFYALMLLLCLWCTPDNKDNFTNIPSKQVYDFPFCKLSCIDSFNINANLSVPKIISKYKNIALVIDRMKSDSIYVLNLEQRNILAKIPIVGNCPTSVGAFLFSAGLLNEYTFVASGTNGYFFFSIKNKHSIVVRKIIDRLDQMWGGSNFKLVFVSSIKDSLLISNRDWPFDISLFYTASPKKEKQLLEKLRYLTVYNINSQKKTIEVPFEKGNKLLNTNISYSNMDQLWDYNYNTGSIYSLINNDETINEYEVNQNNIKVKNRINIKPKYYRHDYVVNMGNKKIDGIKNLIVNSVFEGLLAQKNVIIYTYTLGMPDFEYDTYKNEATLLKARNEKYYPPLHVIYVNKKLYCEECTLQSKYGDCIHFLDDEGFGYSIVNNEKKSQNGFTAYKFKIR